ncbi:hypothetical protein ACGFJ7_19530 [Actinoplanes sp. NPDC048988]|uniref:hypothetical protein n=1 Tax=Actinoplanes sp. NPDC048988 TaxID=3363901 RepID=UPI0037247E11
MPKKIIIAVALCGVAAVAGFGWPIVSARDTVLSTPDTVGPLRLDLSDDGRSTAENLRTVLSDGITVKTAVGAVYLDGTGKNVRFLGGTKSMWAPGSVLDSAFGLLADKAHTEATDLHTVDAGPLGGTMKCGTAAADTVCGWADHGSLALAVFTGRAESDSAQLLRRLREAAESDVR